MSSKHTPGPWLIDPCWDILGNTDDGNGMVCQITTNAVPRAEAAASARLIAAAPELLKALELVVKRCGHRSKDGAIARAAVAKARGDMEYD